MCGEQAEVAMADTAPAVRFPEAEQPRGLRAAECLADHLTELPTLQLDVGRVEVGAELWVGGGALVELGDDLGNGSGTAKAIEHGGRVEGHPSSPPQAGAPDALLLVHDACGEPKRYQSMTTS